MPFRSPRLIQQVRVVGDAVEVSGNDERALRRVVKCVAEETHTMREAIVAEPSLNSQYGDERESFARKVRRHAMRLREEVLAATAAKKSVGYVAAAQKSAKAEPVNNL